MSYYVKTPRKKDPNSRCRSVHVRVTRSEELKLIAISRSRGMLLTHYIRLKLFGEGKNPTQSSCNA